MTSFALAWNREGGPIAGEVSAAIRRELGRRAPQGIRERVGTDWAAWSAPDDWAPGAEAALPLDAHGWTGSGTLRLDDRVALRSTLRDRLGEGADDDASLAWRSFVAWGEQAPEHWLGDYAVAAVSPARDRLIAARGTVGVLHCFYATAGPVVLVADDPATLAAVDGVDVGLDERAVVEYLRTGELVTPTISFRKGIRRVPAAHTLCIDRSGRERIARHWELPAPTVRTRLSEPEAVEGFREVLGRAVADRLRGRHATILLSGGLDSSAVAMVARDNSGAVGLDAVTVSWRALLPHDDEAEWAASAADAFGLPHTIVAMAEDEGFSEQESYWTSEPSPDVEPRLWRSLARRLSAIAPVTLLGEDADTLLAPTTLLDQLRVDGVAATLRAWSVHRRTYGRRPWIGLRQSLRSLDRWRDRALRRPPPWLRREAVRRHPLPDVPAASPHPTRVIAARRLAQPTWESALWSDAPQLSGAPVQVLLPLMDPRVIAFCFSVPVVPWCQRKRLVRASLQGRVSQRLVDRPKTPLRGYYEARMRVWRQRGGAVALPAVLEPWVDLPALGRVLGRERSADAVFAGWRAFELARWLDQPPAEAT